jgi:acetyl-CoA synthetase
MTFCPIVKQAADLALPPLLADYPAARATFSWEAVSRALDCDGAAGCNMARLCVDRHARAAPGREAVRFVDRDLGVRSLTYGALAADVSRFAGLLRRLGVGPGEVVASLLGRVPALYVTALGALKGEDVYCPLFTAFGPEPLRQRLALARVRVLVTTPQLYVRKVAPLRAALPDLAHVLLTGTDPAAEPPDGCLPLEQALADCDPTLDTPPTPPDTPALLHFTSGTTGRPKGAVHPHGAILAQHLSSRLVLDLRAGERFWCTADPGWVTGTVYGILGPLSVGAVLIADPEPFDAERWYRILEGQRVAVWYTAPTAVRMLMRAGPEIARARDLSALRLAASVGEPLNPEAVVWGQEVLGRPFHDTWWQTETGAIMIANYPAVDIRPGSMGRPLPGIEAAVVAREDGHAAPIAEPDVEGELAVRTPWPSMMSTYLGQPERYAACFADGWYLTGDRARRDADGYFWFVGRGDDLIKTSGHLIGPFEVESVLMEHPGVAEAGVIGRPDPIAGQIVKAFVALKPGFADDESLRRSLLAHARRRLGAAVAPKEIEVRPHLPKTRSGKILRRLLRAQETDEDVGDLSTLEGPD